jgi:hypothetical protein
MKYTDSIMNSELLCLLISEPVFVDLLRSPEIDSQPGEIDVSESIPGIHKSLQIRALIKPSHWWCCFCGLCFYDNARVKEKQS